MEPPPSRYRVIEKGRRLVVIDTHAGGAPAAAARPRTHELPVDGPTLSTLRADRKRLATQAWWDAKGPRTIEIDYAGAKSIDRMCGAAIVIGMLAVAAFVYFPGFMLIPAVLFNRALRDHLRRMAAQWLDTLGQTVSGSDARVG